MPGLFPMHKSILGSALAQARHFKFCEDDIMIGCLPLNHVGGITCTIMASLLAKGSVVLVPTFRPDWALEAMEKYKATIFGGVPTMYVMLVNYPELSKNEVSSLRLCIVGGSNVEPKVCRDIEETFPSGRIMNLYGLSETSGACVLSRLEDGVDKVATSIGEVIGDFVVRVLDSNRQALPVGEVGELAFKGDCVASGYIDLPAETQESFSEDGWLYTGDMGCLDVMKKNLRSSAGAILQITKYLSSSGLCQNSR